MRLSLIVRKAGVELLAGVLSVTCLLAVSWAAPSDDPIADLKASDVSVRRAAIDRIVEENLGKGLKPLRQALKDPNVLVRESAAWALGQMRDHSSAQALASTYEAEHSLLVKMAVVEACWKVGGPEAAKTLITAFQDSSPVLRRASALSLGLLEDWDNAQVLLQRMKDPVPAMRESVALGLASYKEKEAEDGLQTLAQDDLASVREKASFGLKLQDKKSLFETASHALASGEEPVRLVAAHALGSWGGNKASVELLVSVQEKDTAPAVRLEAASALEEIKAREEADRKKAEAAKKKKKKKHRKKSASSASAPAPASPAK